MLRRTETQKRIEELQYSIERFANKHDIGLEFRRSLSDFGVYYVSYDYKSEILFKSKQLHVIEAWWHGYLTGQGE